MRKTETAGACRLHAVTIFRAAVRPSEARLQAAPELSDTRPMAAREGARSVQVPLVTAAVFIDSGLVLRKIGGAEHADVVIAHDDACRPS